MPKLARLVQAAGSYATTFRLSPRETELVVLAAHNVSDREAVQAMGVPRDTLSTYWKRIFGKTGLHAQRDVVAAIVHLAVRD